MIDDTSVAARKLTRQSKRKSPSGGNLVLPRYYKTVLETAELMAPIKHSHIVFVCGASSGNVSAAALRYGL